jgi:uncharacterized protein Yka (UPF0111/DUF47 family)
MFGIIPRNSAFFELFDQFGAVVATTAEAYRDLVQDFSRRDHCVERIRQLEHDGDDMVRRTLEKLDTSFITPFDREDIQNLVNRMDDVIDQIDAASKRLKLYRLSEPTPWLRKQSEVALSACTAVAEAVRGLRNLKQPQQIREQLREIHRLENVGDDNHHSAIAELFESATDPIGAMKWKEVYDLTESAIDGCEDIANAIEAIILKNT